VNLAVLEERAFEGGHAQLERWGEGRLTILCLPRDGRGGYRLEVPDGCREDPWQWFAEQGQLGAREETLLMQAIRAGGVALGYSLLLEQSIDEAAGMRWLVSAAPRVPGQAALELGLEVVKAHVERREPWPEHVVIRGR
jgi:hypothetical protein